mgnify:CR=1 FL=1
MIMHNSAAPDMAEGFDRRLASLAGVEVSTSIFRDDCLSWLARRPENSIQAIVTDPPYGLKEYSDIEKQKQK